jgi:hypothetical protein
MSWQNALVLENNEKVVQFWKSNYQIQTTVIKKTWLGKRPKTVEHKKNGILVLTNQKLVWIEEMGIRRKSYHPLVTIPLENIKGVQIGEPTLKSVSIADAIGEYAFDLVDPAVVSRDDLNFLKRIVLDQVNMRKQELKRERKEKE